MISITFRDFYKQNYRDDFKYSLYLVRDAETILYIGIARAGIWSRWFSQRSSHMAFYKNIPVSYGDSREIGRKIELNYPESLEWVIELWTEKDCHKFLSKQGKRYYKDLLNAERCMIEHFKPLYNIQHNIGGSTIPRTDKEKEDFRRIGEAYNEIFNKGQSVQPLPFQDRGKPVT